MAYTKTTDFTSKDSLLTGDPAKVVKGSEIDAEFDNIEAAIGTTTGSGAVVLATSPTLVTPVLGTPTSGTLTNCDGLPISTGVAGLGTGIATALAVNTGSAGAPVLFNGVLGTPTSGTVTNLTGTASININGTVGATTPSSGAFTTLTTTGDVTLGNASGDSVTINAATVSCANGLNFDANTFVIDATNNRVGIGVTPSYLLDASVATGTTVVGNGSVARFVSSTTDGDVNIRLGSGSNSTVRFGASGTAAYIYTNGAERVRIDSSGNFLVGVTSATTNGGKIETSNGVTFPATQSACSNANTLDDYEEGTWTPADASGGVGVTVTPTNGKYQKVGNRVTASAKLVYSSNSDSAYTLISLPIIPASSAVGSIGCVSDYGTGVLARVLGSSSNYLSLVPVTGTTSLTNTQVSGKTFYVTIDYEAA